MRTGLALVFAMGFAVSAQAAEPICGAATHERFGETRAYFKDVLGACRPDGYCSAVVAIVDKANGAAYRQQLRIAKPTGAAAYEVELVAVDPMPAAASPMALTIGRTRFALNVENTASVNEFRVSDAEQAAAIVERAKRGASAVWTYPTETGPNAASFPLRGLTAALTWVDCMGAR